MSAEKNQLPAAADEPEGSATVAVYAERIRTLYRQSVGVLLVNPINAAIVAAVLWPSRNAGLLASWVAAMVALTIARIFLRHRYLRLLPPAEETRLWAAKYGVGAVTAGLLWGFAGALFYEPAALASQLLLVFVIGGMVAGASGVLALHFPAFLGFAAGAVLPVATRMLAEGDGLHLAMGALALVYGVAMALVAANTHRALTETFRLRFENQRLLARLARAQMSLAEANRTLEQRVADRGAALERQTEALREAQRMESVGLLAGGMAHDFNNLLTVVLGNAALLLDRPGLDGEDRTAIEEIRRAANRGVILVSQLLTFSRRQVTMPRVLDLNAVVAEVQRLLGRLIGEHIELVVALHAGPLPVKADATQLEQVIINLATNARDAMATGGRLTIKTELVDDASQGTTAPSGKYVMLSVRDTGVGMDAETKRLAFQPFFTTKEVGRGTGLGLATVYGIVEQSAGHILVDSAPGRGTCFRVFLPWVAVEKVEPLAAPAPATVASAVLRRGTILVVEDEGSVRAVITKVLGAAGYTVIEAENGVQGLEVARRHGAPIDAVVSDIVMAKMGGVELARRIASERPGIRILLVSGYGGKEVPATDDPASAVDFLQKPFTPTALLDKVAKLLARPAPAIAGASALAANAQRTAK